MLSRFKKGGAVVLVAIALAVFGSTLIARPAYAQFVVSDPITNVQTTITNVEEWLDKALLGGVTMAFINSLNYFTQRIAYDTAVWIASGGKGEGPLFHADNFGDYLGDVALDSAGEALGTLTEVGFLGFNLCEPGGPDGPQLRLALALGIAQQYEAPRPRCEWSRISESWDSFVGSFESGEVLERVSLSLSPGQTGIHALFEAPLRVREQVRITQENAERDRNEGQGFRSVTDLVTGQQRTPASIVRETALEEFSSRAANNEKATNASILGPVLARGVTQVLSVGLSTFVNTLSSQLLKRAIGDGLLVTGDEVVRCGLEALVTGECSESTLADAQRVGAGGRAAAQVAFADLLSPRLQEVNNYDAITEFTVCPNRLRTPNNCVMDSGFAAAVRVALQDEPLTIRKAIERGYLHEDWPLVGPSGEDQAKNSDPYCFTDSYCYSNLVKLRRARILPIGFEIAAMEARGEDGRSVTLREVLAGFNHCPTPDDPNPNDPRFRWCHLLDPNWILKYPITQCRLKVYGPTLVSEETDIRAEICVDAPSCVKEGPNGTCAGGFGYCTSEKNIWTSNADSCPAQFALCETYRDSTGHELSVLTNTVDKSVCTEENAGCRAYATAQDPGNGVGDWQTDSGRLFLDSDAGACKGEDAGCSEVLPTATLQMNIVRNPSFEDELIDGNGAPTGRPVAWQGAVSQWVEDAINAQGRRAMIPGTETPGEAWRAGVRQIIFVDPGVTYTLSGYGRRVGAVEGTARLTFGIRSSDGEALVLREGETTCAIDAGRGVLNISPVGATDSSGQPVFDRRECSFTAPNGAEQMELVLASDGNVMLDAIMLETGAVATLFRTEGYANAAPEYIKLPPTWMGCTGEDSDPDTCASYSGMCRADEIGCDSFTPVDGGSAVPGTVSEENICPAVCAGYASYRQEPASFDVAQYPVHLIPSGARTCSAAAAGCSEFTNLDAIASGGEAREYWSNLRVCEKPSGATIPTYYTWEGSDTTGFQLKEWRLKFGVAAVGESGLPPEVIARDTDLARCTQDIYRAGTDPDCREFFDAAGNISYRLYSRTIVISAECRPLRPTELPVDESITEAGSCAAAGGRFNASAGTCGFCDAFGGKWDSADPTNLGCTFFGYAPESKSCAAQDNGCRLYTGNAGRNVRVIHEADFESGSTERWGPDGVVTVSTESTQVGGHSIRVPEGDELRHPVLESPGPSTPGAVRIQNGGTYYLSFWAKGRGALSVGFSGAPAGTSFTNGGVTLGANWNRYSFGPLRVTWEPSADEALTFSGFSDISFIDHIQLTEIASNIALIKDSWTIPQVCDQNAEGALLPQAQLGCTAYRSQLTDQTMYLTGFASLCREKAVGCTAYRQTQQSRSTGRESWNALCALDTPATSPADCVVNGVTVCTVGVGRQSCRYTSDDLPPSVTFTSTTGGTCQIDGTVIVDPVTRRPRSVGVGGTCSGQPTDLVIVPADRTTYAVPSQRCGAEVAGCMLAGKPTGLQLCTLPDGGDAGTDPDVCVPTAGRSTCSCGSSGLIPGAPLLGGAGAGPRIEFTVCEVAAGETACRGVLPWKEPFPLGTRVAYDDVTVLNQPTRYGDSLCTLEANACEAWTVRRANNAPAYFKNPEGRLCEYKENVDVRGAAVSGWFLEGTTLPCDRDYLVAGVRYGIWQNGDPEYQGFGGLCGRQFAGCTEFADPATKSADFPRGQPYYFIKNNKLDDRSCNGQVNIADGCVLFNDTSNPLLSYHTKGTYAIDPEGRGVRISPTAGICRRPSICIAPGPLGTCLRFSQAIDGMGCNSDADCNGVVGETCQLNEADANVVLNVRRDRVCAEWLACKSSSPVWDPALKRFRDVCDAVGLCNESVATAEGTQCVSWINRPAEILSKAVYQDRALGYDGRDFSGHSIPNMYPVESLQQVYVGRYCTHNPYRSCTADADCISDPDLFRLLHGTADPERNTRCGEPQYRLARVTGRCTGDDEGELCADGQSRCWNGLCAQSPSGAVGLGATVASGPQPLEPTGVGQNSETLSCRAYPERNSPFPNSVVTSWSPEQSGLNVRALPQGVQQSFAGASVCEQGQQCECYYNRADYRGGQTTLFTAQDAEAPAGVCQGGERDQQPCDPTIKVQDMPCGEGGVCQALTHVNAFQGLSGYCLERDLSTPINGLERDTVFEQARACATWYPVDRPAGTPDIYNSYTSAGYNVGNAFFCALPEAYQRLVSFGVSGRQKYDVQISGKKYSFSRGHMTVSIVSGFADAVGGSLSTTGRITPRGEETELTMSGVPSGGQVPGQGVIERDCPASVGFAVTAQATESGTITYMCIPWNSRHMADPQKRVCEPPPLGRGYFEKTNDREAAFWRAAQRADLPIAEIYILEGQRSIARNIGMERLDGLEATLLGEGVNASDADQFRESAMTFYGDCQASDTPVPGPVTVAHADFTPYFGCEVPIQVATGGRFGQNKVLTGRLGNGRTPPPGVGYTITNNGSAQMRYNWASTPAPFGQALTNDITNFTYRNNDSTPLEIPICKISETWGLPNAAGPGLSCPMDGKLLTDVNAEVRPFANIVVGDGTPRRCTVGTGVSGDIQCSGGSSICSRPDGGNTCFRTCTPGDDGDQECRDAGQGTCSGQTAGVNHCSGAYPDIRTRAVCESEVGRVYVGRCVNSGASRSCIEAADCVTTRCLPDPTVAPGAANDGICEGTGVITRDGYSESDNNESPVRPSKRHYRSYYPSRPEGARIAFDNIRQLFAQVVRTFLYIPADLRNNKPGEYVPADTLSPTEISAHVAESDTNAVVVYDDSDTRGRPPALVTVGDCSSDGQCLEDAGGLLKVNGVLRGEISGDNARRVTLQFFAYAQNDQMPIRQVLVDWGDGTRVGENPGSSFKNRRGFILDSRTNQYVSRCSNTNFGTSPEACDDSGPFTYTHVYTCDINTLRACAGAGDSNCVTSVGGRQACVYRPRVQIKDNWGFCNGTCTGGPAFDACYDATTNPQLAADGEPNECDFDLPSSRTPYQLFGTSAEDRIIIYPR